MCTGRADEQPVAYRIHRPRVDGVPGPSTHDRTRSSIERHLMHAPLPTHQSNRNKYPKQYRNDRGQFAQGVNLYEYPSMPYGYGGAQNRNGHTYQPLTGKMPSAIEPGFTRTMTDNNKKIHGVGYHPQGDLQRIDRADEVYSPARFSKKQRVYAFPKDQGGRRARVR